VVWGLVLKALSLALLSNLPTCHLCVLRGAVALSTRKKVNSRRWERMGNNLNVMKCGGFLDLVYIHMYVCSYMYVYICINVHMDINYLSSIIVICFQEVR
jgi:hypothetical protein